MNSVRPIEGELLRYHVAGKTVRCTSQSCANPPWANNRTWPGYDPEETFPPCPLCGGIVERVWYLVDLGELAGNGQCSCEHFDFRLRKVAMDRLLLPADDLAVLVEKDPQRCSHIMRARRVFVDEIIRRLDNERKAKHEGTQRTATMGLAPTPWKRL